MIIWKKILYIALGITSLLLGVVGIFVPGVPTTPLILLSIWAFSHSWLAMHNKLNSNPFVRKYINRKSVPLHIKIISILIMLTMVSLSTSFYWDKPIIAYSLIGVGITGLIFMMKHIKVKNSNED